MSQSSRSDAPADTPGPPPGRRADVEPAASASAAEIDAAVAEIDAAVAELAELTARQRDVLRDTLDATATLAAIRSSNTGRLLEAGRRVRGRLRAPYLWLVGRRRWRRRPRRLPGAVRARPLGVNVAGYLSTESGMGEAARASVRSLEAAAIPFVLNNVDSFLRMQDLSYTSFTGANPHPFNLVHLNADNMAPFARRQGRGYFRDRYTIGYWFWELSSMRPDWVSAFGIVDEVWVATTFGRETLLPIATVPVVRIPLPIVLPEPESGGRAHFGLPEQGLVFLFAFDVSSQIERKNPVGVIRAFRRSGLSQAGATLVLKYTNAEYDRDAVRRLHEEADGLNVRMIDGYLSRRELTTLMHAADCYVSLHRSEGFGITLAESMRLGKPVIATGYSGNMDFMTPENSYVVPYNVVPLTRDHGPYLRGFTWAEPDLDQAAAYMREVAEQPQLARAKGAQACTEIAASRHPEATGRLVRERLEAIRRAGAREAVPAPSRAQEPVGEP